jgi:hypothetical protein
VVAQRLGFDEDEALTLGKALAGLNAQAKGRRLGLFKPHEEEPKQAREKGRGEPVTPAGHSRVALGAVEGDARPPQIPPSAFQTDAPFFAWTRRPREDRLLSLEHRRSGRLCRLHSKSVPRGGILRRSLCQWSGGLPASVMISWGKRKYLSVTSIFPCSLRRAYCLSESSLHGGVQESSLGFGQLGDDIVDLHVGPGGGSTRVEV